MNTTQKEIKRFEEFLNLTQEEIKKYEEMKEERIQELIEYGLNREEAIIEEHWGFPIIQLIKNQKGKCYSCCKDLVIPENGSKIEEYEDLNECAMKSDDDRTDNYKILGDYHGYRLFCGTCCGLDPLIDEFEE